PANARAHPSCSLARVASTARSGPCWARGRACLIWDPDIARLICDIAYTAAHGPSTVRAMQRRGAARHPDAAQWLARTANDKDPGTIWIRQRLDWKTGEVAIECSVCGREAVRLPIWTLATPTMRSRTRLDWDRIRACALHTKETTDDDPTPDRHERDHRTHGPARYGPAAPARCVVPAD